MPVEVLYNQASKQPGTINNTLKMQRELFHRSHDIENKLLIIIHVDKMSVQKEISFSQTKQLIKQNLELFLEHFTLETHKK